MASWEFVQIPLQNKRDVFMGRFIFSEVTKKRFPDPPEFWFNNNNSNQKLIRGEHLHEPFSKTELVVFLGKCLVSLHSSQRCENFLIEDPSRALLIFPGTWHAFNLYPGSSTIHFSSSLAAREKNHPTKPCDH